MKLLKKFKWYLMEREQIRANKEACLPRPWTRDVILANNHFTNVRRTDDPGTKFILERMNRSVGIRQLAFEVYAYRLLNRKQTFELLGFPKLGSSGKWAESLRALQKKQAVGSARHFTSWQRMLRGLKRLEEEQRIIDDLLHETDGIKAVEQLIKYHIGVGYFFGTQIVADLATAGIGNFSRDVLVPVSSGSRIGLWIAEGRVNKEFIDKRLSEASSLIAKYKPRNKDKAVGGWFKDVRVAKTTQEEIELLTHLRQKTGLSFIDLEHSLCEFYRYWQIKSELSGSSRMNLNERA